MIDRDFAHKIFEGFSIQRWNDLIRPFDIVEMDKAGEKMVIAYIIGKFEEILCAFVDWNWIIYASLFDLLKKIALCDIKATVQQILKTDYCKEYLKLNEWVLNQYKPIIDDKELLRNILHKNPVQPTFPNAPFPRPVFFPLRTNMLRCGNCKCLPS